MSRICHALNSHYPGPSGIFVPMISWWFSKPISISKNALVFAGMLMAFTLTFLFIILWYQVQITTIDKRIDNLNSDHKPQSLTNKQ